jgi:hypothetical protein
MRSLGCPRQHSGLKTRRHLPEYTELLWKRIDDLLDQRIALMRDCPDR